MSKIIENYSLHEVLGSGQYGKVYKALNLKNNTLVAIKVVRSDKFRDVPKLEEFTMNEIQTLARINNQNIVKFIEMLRTSNHYYFVYEYCNGGTLESLLKAKGHFLEDEALQFFRELVNAFKSLTKENIMHRDLKPANILLHNDKVKLADFGFCKALNGPKDMTTTMVGSPVYMAPEVLNGLQYGPKAEIWSLGCVLYELLFGECPYEESSIAKLITRMNDTNVEILRYINPISKETENLLLRMLVKDPERRMNFSELYEHRFFAGDTLELPTQQHLAVPPEGTSMGGSGVQISKTERRKNDRAFKYLLNERNKLFFMYDVLSRMIEYNFAPDSPLYGFCLIKYIKNYGNNIKKNLVDDFNVKAFVQLSRLYENWSNIPKSFEYKSFSNLMLKEVSLVETNFTLFSKEVEEFKRANPHYKMEDSIMEELGRKEVHIKTFQKILLSYAEKIKERFFSSTMHNSHEEEMKKWLLHVNEVLDCVAIDEFFENFIDVYLDFGQQKYFEMLTKYQVDNLLNIITSKIEFTRKKLS